VIPRNAKNTVPETAARYGHTIAGPARRTAAVPGAAHASAQTTCAQTISAQHRRSADIDPPIMEHRRRVARRRTNSVMALRGYGR
jgi:hypothetical protein